MQTEVKTQVYTRNDFETIFQCKSRTAWKLFKEVLATIPEAEYKQTFKHAVPIHYVDKFLGKKSC